MEKFISINETDKSIFTQDREAYPFKVISTDRERTKVEQTTQESEPLQCKERFFDNKKSIEYDKSCDGIYLMYKKQINENIEFKVKIDTNREYCVVKIESYLEEEDIQNVLSGIIEFIK